MKLGSRIVSHQFEIPGVRPDKSQSLRSEEDGQSHAVHVWTLPLSKLVRRIEWPGNHIYHTAFSPDGRLYLGGGDTGTLRIWEVASGKQVVELPVTIGCFTPDGKQILGHNLGKTISLFDVATGRELRKWEMSSPVDLRREHRRSEVMGGLNPSPRPTWRRACAYSIQALPVVPELCVFSSTICPVRAASAMASQTRWVSRVA